MKLFKHIFIFVFILSVLFQARAEDNNQIKLAFSARPANQLMRSLQSTESNFITQQQSILSQQEDDETESAEVDTTEFISNILSNIGGIDGLSSSLTNFLPNFQLASLLSEGDPFGGEDQIKIDVGYLLFDRNSSKDKKENNTKFTLLVNRQPSISEDIIAAFGEETISPLNDGIDSFDDIEVQFSYNLNSKSLGRTLNKNQQLFTRLAKEIYNSNVSKMLEEKKENLIFELLASEEFVDVPDGTDIQTSTNFIPNQAQRDRAELLVKEIYQADDAFYQSVSAQFRTSHLSSFRDLISNQPQFFITAKYRSRDDLIGPDEFELEINYEFSLANLNRLRKKTCGNKTCNSFTLEQFENVLQEPKFKRQLENNDRFSLSLSYSDISDHRFDFSGNRFLRRGGSALKASANYGRSLRKEVSRLDIGINFEDFSGSTEGNDQLSGSITYTHRLTDRLSLPISLQFANRSEFLSNTSTQFGGHIGLSWDLVSKKNTEN